MSDIFHEYMSKRLDEVNLNDLKTKPGPIVTISRAAGCPSQKLVKDLTLRLNQLAGAEIWDYISKDVLYESAKKLELHPKMIKSVFKIKDRTVLDDIMQAFLSKDYHLERKMRNTVINIVHQFGIEGHKIIVGRAAHIICSDIKDSLHIRIDAPFEWKLNNVMRTKNFNKDEGIACIANTERDRSNFRKSIKGKLVDDEFFDLTINQARYTNNEMIDLIIAAMHLRKII